MKKILFDCSSHLGQFCTSDEEIRMGCKNMQASISLNEADDCVGAWTDLENGRADRSIWNLPEEVQAHYYPIMDRFYSITNVRQEPLSEEEEDIALRLRTELPGLSVYSRHTCARAIAHGITEVYTLIEELLADAVRSHMSSTHGVNITKPSAKEEIAYADDLLEQRYQSAIQAFRLLEVNVPTSLADTRRVAIPAG
jgi:hypothetical protein